jgi:predicted  nucleic acid-binding Zn-ribbon protein
MTIEVSQLYVPTHVAEEEDEGAPASNGVPQPNMDAATATVQSGVEELIAGVDSLAASVGKTKEEVKEGVSIAVSQVNTALDELCTPELLDCYAPEPEDPLELSEVIATLDQTIAAINAYVAQAEGTTDPLLLVDYLNRIEEDVTETLTEAQAALAEAQAAIVEANAAIAEANTAKAEAANAKAEAEAALATNQQVLADLQATLADQEAEYEANCLTTSIEGETDWGPSACVELQKIINNTKKAIDDTQKSIDQSERSIKANDLTIAAADASIKKNELTIARSEAAIQRNELTVAAAERALTVVNEAQAYV